MDTIRDRKDKLASKLYMKKLEFLLEDDVNNLLRCVYCNKLFTSSQRSWMVCNKAEIFIDFHGSVIAQHVSDRTWDINKFVLFMRQKGLNWRDIFWKIWGHLNSFDCMTCDSKFIAAEIEFCSFHPQKPKFNIGSNSGK